MQGKFYADGGANGSPRAKIWFLPNDHVSDSKWNLVRSHGFKVLLIAVMLCVGDDFPALASYINVIPRH